MKKTLIIFFCSLVLFSCEEGPLIENYKIEGISIGDTLFDFMSEKEILKQINNPLVSYDNLDPPRKYLQIFKYDGLETYSRISIFVENGDKKYIIQGIEGELKNSSIEECLEEKSKTIEEFDILFKEESRVSNFDSASQSTPGGFIYEHDYFLNTSDVVSIQCFEAPGFTVHNSLIVSLQRNVLHDWLVVK